MARLRVILGALVTAVRRDLESIGSFTGNNLFVVSLVLLFLNDPGAFVALNVLIGVVIFIPLSSDPLRVIPADRLVLWPLTTNERRALRLLSPLLNPVTWLIIGLALWRNVSMGLAALAAAIFAIGFVLPSLPGFGKGMWRRIPNFPGPLNQLIRKNSRELLSTLDFWCSLLLSAAALGFRAAGLLPPDALLPMTVIVMLAISTHTQSLFGLDGDGGLTRYHLLPLPSWQMLVAKDVPFLMAALLLTAPLAPLSGFAGALAALAMGHHASVIQHRDQTRWRFSTGSSFGASIFQVIVLAMAAASVRTIPLLMVLCAGAYIWSTWWYGRAFGAEKSE
jgi:hypothetical protein